jgi:hypothetical protein
MAKEPRWTRWKSEGMPVPDAHCRGHQEVSGTAGGLLKLYIHIGLVQRRFFIVKPRMVRG